MIQLADDIQPDLREGIFEQCEKDGNKVVDGRLFPQHWRQFHYHSRQSSSHVLTAVLGKFADTGEDRRYDLAVREELAEECHFTSCSNTNLSLRVTKQADKGWAELRTVMVQKEGDAWWGKTLSQISEAPRNSPRNL